MKNILLGSMVVIALMAGAFAQDDPTGTVLGFIVDEGTLAGIEGATVTIVPGYDNVTTNGLGYFIFEEVAYGPHMVVVTAPGYENYVSVTTVANPLVTLFNASLTPSTTPEEGEAGIAGTLTGFVVNGQSLSPISDVTITLNPGAITINTSEFGTFMLGNLDFGDYTVEAAADGYEPFTDTVQISSAVPEAINIMLAPAQEGEVVETGSIAGFVLDAVTLSPITYATLLLTPGDVERQANAFGAFAYTEVAYGDYSLQVSATGYNQSVESVSISTSTITTVQVFLQPEDAEPTGAIAGVVTRSGSTPAPIAGVTVTLKPGDLSVETNALGAYAFTGVAYGNYTLLFAAEGYESSSQAVAVEEEGLVTANASLTSLSTDPTGAITGIVLNAWTFEAIPGATVSIVPGDTETQTGPVGNFLFENLAYGSYTVHVSADSFQDSSTLVEVDGTLGSVITVELTPAIGDSVGVISGFVRDAATMLPIQGAIVSVSPGGLQDDTNVAGAFLFSNVDFGEYTVQIIADGYDTATEEALLDGAIVTLDVLLTPTGTILTGSIAGAVNDAETLLPVPGAQVTLTPGDLQTQANAFGLFSFDDLPYGDYIAGAIATGYEANSVEATVDSALPTTVAISLQAIPAEGEGEGEVIEGEGEIAEGEGEAIEGEGEIAEGENEGEGEIVENEGEVSEGEDGEGEGEDMNLTAIAQSLLDQFDIADTNDDEKLDLEEGQSVYSSLTQLQFETLDLNEDGYVTEYELNTIIGNDPGGCCNCQNENKSFNWRLILKQYWLIAAAMIGMVVLSKQNH